VFHTYYLQLKRAIEVEPHMTPNTLQRFQTLKNFNVDRHFIYITVRVDEHKEQLQSYYKLTEEDLEEITKEWSADLLIPTNLAEIYDLYNPEDTHKEHNTPKKTKEVQNLRSTLGKTASVSPDRGGDDEVEVEQNPSEVTSPRDEVEPLKKRKVSPQKTSSCKKSKATMTKMKNFLTSDDFDFIIAALNEVSWEIT
jgi:hypothetical protein